MNTKILGRNIHVFVGGKSVALATSHSFNISVSTSDVTTKDDFGMFTNNEATSISWDCSSDHFVSAGTDGHSTADILDLVLIGEKVDVIVSLPRPVNAEVPVGGFVPEDKQADNEFFCYKGKAIITSCSISAPNGERATYSISMTGCGKLEKAYAPTTPEGNK